MSKENVSSDMTSGSLMSFIDQSSLDVLRSEILKRKQACVSTPKPLVKQLRLKRQSDRALVSKEDCKRTKSVTKTKRDLSLTNDEYDKCRERMMAKCDLYEKLSTRETLPNEDNPFMVDFERKQSMLNISSNVFSTAGEIVEFVDKFGRTRQCDRKSLSKFTGMNAPDIYDGVEEEAEIDKDENVVNPVHDASINFCNDQHRERLRKKWEEDIQAMSGSVDVHYEHLRFDEVRDLGAGYFSFSKNAKEREAQLQRFRDMRQETLLAQEKSIMERIRKHSQLSERMRRVRLNRGLAAADDGESAVQQLMTEMVSATEEIVALRSEMTKQIEQAQQAARRLDARSSSAPNPFNSPSNYYDAHLARMREERDPEFAPPREQ